MGETYREFVKAEFKKRPEGMSAPEWMKEVAKKWRGIVVKGGKITPEKKKIASQFVKVTEEQAQKDLENFLTTSRFPKNAYTGNRFLDYFFKAYRLDTVSKGNISFYDFVKNLPFYRSKKYINDLFLKGTDALGVYNLYFAAVSQFKPVVAYNLYKRYDPTTVLDFSAGWGGRMLAAVKYGCNYIGFDTNTDLKTPYKKMLDYLEPKSKVQIIFKDSATVDYSKYKYDMVFTSPPYFKKERYESMPEYENYEEWVDTFLTPVISNTYRHLSDGGVYALNVPKAIYKDVKKILGRAPDKRIPLETVKRRKTGLARSGITYNEFIYVWQKS